MLTNIKFVRGCFIRNKLYPLFLLVLFFSFSLNSCAEKQIIVPRVTTEPTENHLVGKFVWYDLITHDLQSTDKFYKELFGWEFVDISNKDQMARTITRNGVPIGNAVQVDREKDNINVSRWLPYMSVESVDIRAVMAEEYDGSIYTKAKELPDRGRIAVIIDSYGAIFGLVQTTEGDPPDRPPVKNNWVGSELWTVDLSKAINFYKLLIGYEHRVVDIGQGREYHLLLKDGKARAGVAQIYWDDVQPNWIPYVAVEDTMATIEKAQRHGSTVLIHPSMDYRDNPVAIIADPSGAVFGIQQIR
jgi:predicted enzyme related to lactoylglutathione lyase